MPPNRCLRNNIEATLMNNQEITRYLQQLRYPGLDKTLEELQLLGNIHVTDAHASVELLTANDNAFQTLKQQIEQQLHKHFNSIHIHARTVEKQPLHHGNTARPNNRAPYAKNVIAVTSGKGGVGKSTVAINLAISLAKKGYQVGLLDADVYGPNIPRLSNTDTERVSWNDHDQMVPSENFGLKIMSVALTTPRNDTPLVWRSSVAVSALMQFLDDVAWGALDFLVIDMPPGTGDIQLSMAQELPITAAVLVTTPQIVATDDVSRAIMMFKDIHVPMAGIVENMSYFIAPDTQIRYDIFGSGGGERIAQKYHIPFLGAIPLEMEIREASDRGEPPSALGSDKQKKYYDDIVANMQRHIAFTQRS